MTVVCVTGMHRSGTSLLARAASLVGVDLGPGHQLLPPDPDNPAGYWEDRRIVQLNDTLLGHLGGWWHRPPQLDDGWQYDWRLEPFRVWGAQLMVDRIDHLEGQSTVVGFKDPRLSLLLPFWRTLVEVRAAVISIRDPREVVLSLGRRDGFDAEWCAYLWLRYTAASVVNAPDGLLVRYDSWFRDAESTLCLLAAHLGCARPGADVHHALADTVDPSLRRNPPGDGEGKLLAAVVELYERLETGPAAAHIDEMTELAASPMPGSPT